MERTPSGVGGHPVTVEAFVGRGLPSLTVTGLPGATVMATRKLDDNLAAELSTQAGVDIRLLPMTAWQEAVDPACRDVHSLALATGDLAVAPIPARREYAASLPVFASTGEAILLIEARLPTDQATGAVGSFGNRLVVITLLLAGAALLASLLLARRIGTPLQALAASAERLGQGDFSSSIPAQGTQEVEALARTMEDMRRNLMDLTATLRHREAEAQAALDGVVEGVYAVDVDRRIRYLNPQAAKMLGAPAGGLVGKFCADVLKPRDVNGRRPAWSDPLPYTVGSSIGAYGLMSGRYMGVKLESTAGASWRCRSMDIEYEVVGKR